jgi:hypothetical protein
MFIVEMVLQLVYFYKWLIAQWTDQDRRDQWLRWFVGDWLV